MTREEAIKIINCYDIGFYDLSGEKIPADKLAEALDMAIEALSTPSGDLISRADAINTLETEKRCTDREEDVSGLTLAKLLISALPSADAVSKEEHVKALNDLAVAWKNKLDEESYEKGYTAGQFADRPKGEWIPHTTSVGLKHYAEYARCSERKYTRSSRAWERRRMMTRKEAINTLKKLYATFDDIHETTDFEDGREEMEALDLAIEALKKLDRGYIDKGLLMFLALSFPAPEDAPDDWFHHGDENLDAWRAYIMKCKERGYYDIPMIDGQAYWQTEDGRETKAEYSVYCSKCGSWSEYRTKYCGNCGSLMKEENDEQ